MIVSLWPLLPQRTARALPAASYSPSLRKREAVRSAPPTLPSALFIRPYLPVSCHLLSSQHPGLAAAIFQAQLSINILPVHLISAYGSFRANLPSQASAFFNCCINTLRMEKLHRTLLNVGSAISVPTMRSDINASSFSISPTRLSCPAQILSPGD